MIGEEELEIKARDKILNWCKVLEGEVIQSINKGYIGKSFALPEEKFYPLRKYEILAEIDNFFSALNYTVWSNNNFFYIEKK